MHYNPFSIPYTRYTVNKLSQNLTSWGDIVGLQLFIIKISLFCKLGSQNSCSQKKQTKTRIYTYFSGALTAVCVWQGREIPTINQ